VMMRRTALATRIRSVFSFSQTICFIRTRCCSSFSRYSGSDDTNGEIHSKASWQGIFTKHLQYYIDHAGDGARVKYGVFLTSQSSGVHFYATGSDDVSRIEPGTLYTVTQCRTVPRFRLVREEQRGVDIQSKVDGERLGSAHRSS
jgi:hypothetical protein